MKRKLTRKRDIMDDMNITVARNEVYDALNLYEQLKYKENGKYEQKVWKHVIKKHETYKNIGGVLSLELFQSSLLDYLYSGYCGY